MKVIKRMHVITQLPNRKFTVSGYDGKEFTSEELEKLQKVIDCEYGGINIWVI